MAADDRLQELIDQIFDLPPQDRAELIRRLLEAEADLDDLELRGS